MESAKRSIICFFSGGTKQGLAEKWATWQAGAKLPPEQRPTQKPMPWRFQVACFLEGYLVEGMSGSMSPDVEKVLGESKIWPQVLTGCHTKILRKVMPPGQWLSSSKAVRSRTQSGTTSVATPSLPSLDASNQWDLGRAGTVQQRRRAELWTIWVSTIMQKAVAKVGAAPNVKRPEKPPAQQTAKPRKELKGQTLECQVFQPCLV